MPRSASPLDESRAALRVAWIGASGSEGEIEGGSHAGQQTESEITADKDSRCVHVVWHSSVSLRKCNVGMAAATEAGVPLKNPLLISREGAQGAVARARATPGFERACSS